jgi:hydrogenase maturation protease
MIMRPQIAVVGVGNMLRTDDGIGVHAIRALQQSPPCGVALFDIGTAVLHGLTCLQGMKRVLVIDAARGGQPPGTMYLFDAPAKPSANAFASIHAMGLCEAMRFLSYSEDAPVLTVLGVEPASLGIGTELSARLQAALPQVVARARATVVQWLLESPRVLRRTVRPEPMLV